MNDYEMYLHPVSQEQDLLGSCFISNSKRSKTYDPDREFSQSQRINMEIQNQSVC